MNVSHRGAIVALFLLCLFAGIMAADEPEPRLVCRFGYYCQGVWPCMPCDLGCEWQFSSGSGATKRFARLSEEDKAALWEFADKLAPSGDETEPVAARAKIDGVERDVVIHLTFCVRTPQ